LSNELSYSTLSPVTTGTYDCLLTSIPSRYLTKPTRSTEHSSGVAKSNTSFNWLGQRQECHLCMFVANCYARAYFTYLLFIFSGVNNHAPIFRPNDEVYEKGRCMLLSYQSRVISICTCFPSTSKTFLFRQSFPAFVLRLYYASVDFVIVLLF